MGKFILLIVEVLILVIGISQIVLPIFTGWKFFWLFRKDGRKSSSNDSLEKEIVATERLIRRLNNKVNDLKQKAESGKEKAKEDLKAAEEALVTAEKSLEALKGFSKQ